MSSPGADFGFLVYIYIPPFYQGCFARGLCDGRRQVLAVGWMNSRPPMRRDRSDLDYFFIHLCFLFFDDFVFIPRYD